MCLDWFISYVFFSWGIQKSNSFTRNLNNKGVIQYFLILDLSLLQPNMTSN